MRARQLLLTLFLFLFFWGDGRSADAASKRTIEIRRLLSDMRDSKVGYDKNILGAKGFRDMATGHLLLEGEADNYSDDGDEDMEKADAFQADILTDASCLRPYWKELTSDQRSFVQGTLDSLK